MKNTNNLERRAKLNLERNKMQADKEQNIANEDKPQIKRKLQRELNKWISAGRPLVFN